MSLSKNRLSFGLRLTSATLAAALVGCSSNPSADDYDSSVATGSTSSAPRYEESASTQPATTYEPVLERVSDPVPLAQGHPNEYVVKVGDTLWDIAGTFLRDPWYWPEIWYVNPEIENPQVILTGWQR